MFSSTLLLSVLALAINAVSAQQQVVSSPPGCLIKAANELPGGLANYKGFCGNSSAADTKLVDYCPTQYYDTAVSMYSALCKSKGFTVAAISHTSSSTAHGKTTATGSASAKETDSAGAADSGSASNVGATGASASATSSAGTGGAAVVGVSAGAVLVAGLAVLL